MRISARYLAVLFATLPSWGCGKDTVIGPTPVPGGNDISYTILSGEDSSGLSAIVEVGGKDPVTTSNGQAKIPNVYIGTRVKINSAGFLERLDLVRDNNQTIYLWPDRPGFDQNFTQQLVYSTGRLIRIVTGIVYIKLSPELNDSATRIRQQEAADKMTVATEGKITFVLNDSPPAGSIIIESVIDPLSLKDNASAGANRLFQQNILVGGQIFYRDINYAQNVRVICHEIGHMLGLDHVISQSSFMNPSNPIDLTPNDLLGMRMMFLRSPGNLFPDNGQSIR